MKNLLIRVLVFFLLIGGLSFLSWSSASAEEMTCPDHTAVNIDIKPGGYPNKINLSSSGLLPVAVLTTQDFNASLFITEPEMAHLSDAGTAMTQSCAGPTAVRSVLDDVNRDGQPDLVFFFRTQDLNLDVNSTAATLMAHGSYNSTEMHIMGTDTVTVIP